MNEIELPSSHPWPINVISEVKEAVLSSFYKAANSPFLDFFLKLNSPRIKTKFFYELKPRKYCKFQNNKAYYDTSYSFRTCLHKLECLTTDKYSEKKLELLALRLFHMTCNNFQCFGNEGLNKTRIA
jgi:hypothetical protein